MPITSLAPAALRLSVDPQALGFATTADLVHEPLPWVGQDRACTAARFGLHMPQSGYNLLVLGEVGTGRSSLLRQEAEAVAATRPVPPDLCYLHNFDAPEHPRALRMPAGQGRQLRQLMGELCKTLEVQIPRRLARPEVKAESDRITQRQALQEAQAYAALTDFAQQRQFTLRRDDGQLVFTYVGDSGHAMTEAEAAVLAPQQRAHIDQVEQELRAEILHFLEVTGPGERAANDALAALRRQTLKPLLDHEIQAIRMALKKHIKDSVKLGHYLDQVAQDVLDHLELFEVFEPDDEARQEALANLLLRYRVNLVVDNAQRVGAPVICEDNPQFRTLFGSIEYQSDEDVLVTDFSRIRAGSLLKAHGGFLLLHLRDLLTDEVVWEKLRRFLRNGRLQIEEPATALSAMASVSLEPEAVDVQVKIILIGSTEHHYAVQEADPEFARHFRVKVDFAESFRGTDDTRRASGVFVAQVCARHGLPHFSCAAVAQLIEAAHREADDQTRQSALFAQTEALVLESAALCRQRGGALVEVDDVQAAQRARRHRHDYPEQALQESIVDGDRLIRLSGSQVGQINGLTQIDLGDYRFGFPVRLTARTFAGHEGLLNIEREVEMSGPIHDKGVLILHSYLSALFSHIAPLALAASVVFEQEYHGVEGDSASCAELYVLLSSLSGVPLKQGIAVTGAVNQFGEVLPVGGLNEKIEGYFRICQRLGLDGQQGVLIPQRNRRHLMLGPEVIDAVAQGRFSIYTVDHVSDGLQLLTGLSTGVIDGSGNYPKDSVLGRAQARLLAFRRACARAASGGRL